MIVACRMHSTYFNSCFLGIGDLRSVKNQKEFYSVDFQLIGIDIRH